MRASAGPSSIVHNHIDRGVAARRVAAIGQGELYPVASKGFEEGRRPNRRVTILLKARAV